MEITKDLEEKIKELIKANKIVEAISIVQNELKSKEIVDEYRK